MDLSLVDADFELFVLLFHGSHFVGFFAFEKSKIYFLYSQIKTELYKLIVQKQYLFDFVFYLINQKTDRKV